MPGGGLVYRRVWVGVIGGGGLSPRGFVLAVPEIRGGPRSIRYLTPRDEWGDPVPADFAPTTIGFIGKTTIATRRCRGIGEEITRRPSLLLFPNRYKLLYTERQSGSSKGTLVSDPEVKRPYMIQNERRMLWRYASPTKPMFPVRGHRNWRGVLY